MSRTIQQLAAGTALLALSATATAGYVPMTWEDTYTPESRIELNRKNDFYSFTHDIRDDGFDVGTDLALNYSLSLDLHDDGDKDGFLCLWGCEIAGIDLPGIIDTRIFEVDYENVEAGWSLAGLFFLNAFGMLQVDIHRLSGDFYFGGSTLQVHGKDYATVPEPGSLLLFAAGLAGLGLKRRRTTAATVS